MCYFGLADSNFLLLIKSKHRKSITVEMMTDTATDYDTNRSAFMLSFKVMSKKKKYCKDYPHISPYSWTLRIAGFHTVRLWLNYPIYLLKCFETMPETVIQGVVDDCDLNFCFYWKQQANWLQNWNPSKLRQ